MDIEHYFRGWSAQQATDAFSPLFSNIFIVSPVILPSIPTQDRHGDFPFNMAEDSYYAVIIAQS